MHLQFSEIGHFMCKEPVLLFALKLASFHINTSLVSLIYIREIELILKMTLQY